MQKEIFYSSSAQVLNSPQKQEDKLFVKKSTQTTKNRLFQNLINFPRQITDVEGFFLDLWSARVEHFRLSFDSVYCGKEKSFGDGSTVVILPGFGTWRWWYQDTQQYLENAGFKPVAYFPRLNNFGSWIDMFDGSLEFLAKLNAASESKPNVIAHSLGAYLMRIAAEETPTLLEANCRNIFLVGAPLPDHVNIVIETGFLLSQLPFAQRQVDEFIFRLNNLKGTPKLNGVKVFEIESQNDLIVASRQDIRRENTVFFKSSHSALLKDPDVLGFISKKLAANLAAAA